MTKSWGDSVSGRHVAGEVGGGDYEGEWDGSLGSWGGEEIEKMETLIYRNMGFLDESNLEVIRIRNMINVRI